MRTTALRGAVVTAAIAVVALPVAASAVDNGVTKRVSVTKPGGNTANGDSTRDSISEDGNYVTFQSRASNLVAGDNNGKYDVFYVDRRNPAGTMTLVSRAAGGAGSANHQSNFSDVNGDGTVVVFDSEATNIMPGGNHSGGVYARYMKNDPRTGRSAGTVVQVDLSVSGGQPSGTSGRPTISADGRYVAFNSNAPDLATGVRHSGDIYVRDLWNNVTKRVTYSASGGAVNGPSFRAQISSNGDKIAYQTQASNIDNSVSDTNRGFDIYVSPNPFLTAPAAPKGELASVTPQGTAGGGQRPSMSGNGQYTAFQSNQVLAQPAIAGRTNVFRRDLVNNRTIVVSERWDGSAATVNSTRGVLNFDGSIVGFVSGDRQIIKGDLNGQRDVFLRQLPDGPTVAVSVDADTGKTGDVCGGSGTTPVAAPATADFRPGADDISTRPALSSSGLEVAFVSSFCNLERGVRNDGTRNDVLVRVYPSSPF